MSQKCFLWESVSLCWHILFLFKFILWPFSCFRFFIYLRERAPTLLFHHSSTQESGPVQISAVDDRSPVARAATADSGGLQRSWEQELAWGIMGLRLVTQWLQYYTPYPFSYSTWVVLKDLCWSVLVSVRMSLKCEHRFTVKLAQMWPGKGNFSLLKSALEVMRCCLSSRC